MFYFHSIQFMKTYFRLLLCIYSTFLLSFGSCFGQKIKYSIAHKQYGDAISAIDKILKEKNLNLTIGIAVVDLKYRYVSEGIYYFYSNNEKYDSVKYKSQVEFPTMSVYKFHLALAILKEVDEGKFDLNEELIITKYDLLEETYSPLRDKLKKEFDDKYEEKTNFAVKTSELLSYMVSKSDNNVCDILFRLLGGKAYTKEQVAKEKKQKKEFSETQIIECRNLYNRKGVEKTNSFVRKLGLKNTNLAASEEKMHKDFNSQYLNTTTPTDAVLLLKHFYQGEILKKETQDFLWKIMIETQTGANKLKAGLPQSENIVLGHKTGSSFRKEPTEEQELGLKVAENDIGIVVAPTKSYTIAIFIKNSTESNETNTTLMAEISKMIFEAIN